MAQNKNNNKGNISGRNIYLDRHGQTVYYDWLTKNGYLIDKKVEGKFYVYKNRLVLVLIIIILFSEYFPSWVHAVIAGIAIYLMAELLFRFRFLPSLSQTSKFNRENRQTLLRTIIDSKEPRKAILRAVLYLAFAVLIVVNAWMMEASIAVLVVSALLSVMACYCVIINLIALTKMK